MLCLAEEDTGPCAQQPGIEDGNGDVEGAETTSQSNLLRVGIIVLGLLFVGAIAWASTMTSRYIDESSNKDPFHEMYLEQDSTLWQETCSHLPPFKKYLD